MLDLEAGCLQQLQCSSRRIKFYANVEQDIKKAGNVFSSIDQLQLLPSVAGILSTFQVDKVVVIVTFNIYLTAKCYIDKMQL